MIEIKRVYETASQDDGFRVLVDRVWPRGISKSEAKVDLWLKEAGPSTELRKWFAHDPAKFQEFEKRYQNELRNNPAAQELSRIAGKHPVVTLVYSAKDTEHNQAVVLRKFLA